MKINHSFFAPGRLTLIATALMATFHGSLAIADDLAPYIDPDSSISVGAGAWNKDRRQQGMFGGQNKDQGYLLLDADVARLDRDSGVWLGLKARNVGSDPMLRVDYLKQGSWGVYGLFDQITRNDPNKIYTNTTGIGTTTQVVSNVATLGANPLDLKLQRQMTELGGYRNLADGLDLYLSFKNETKTGNRHWSKGDEQAFIAEPIDNVIRQMEATLNYTLDKLQLSGGYYGSWYRTENKLTTAIRNNAPIYLSMPLDNQAHEFFLNGGYQLGEKTRATFKLSYAQATQNDHIPTSDIPGLAAAGTPESLSAKVVTTNAQVGLNSRLSSNLSVNAMLRYVDIDDRTSPYVIVTNTTNVQPYSSTTTSGLLEATYRLMGTYSVTGGIDLKHQERPVAMIGGSQTAQRKVPHRSTLNEVNYRLQVRRSMSETANGSVTLSHNERNGRTFTLTDSAIQDMINPIHLADRKRDKARAAIDWTPMQALNIQLAGDVSYDRYAYSAERPYGIRDGRGAGLSADVSYDVSEDWQLTGFLSRDMTEAHQYNSTLGVANSVQNNRIKEVGTSFGLGVRGAVTSALRVGGNVEWTRTKNSYVEQSPVALTANSTLLPNVETTLTRVSLFGEYALNKQSDVRVNLIHERWHSNDWQWTFADGSPFVYGVARDGTIVVSTPQQSSTFLGARYIYKFQ